MGPVRLGLLRSAPDGQWAVHVLSLRGGPGDDDARWGERGGERGLGKERKDEERGPHLVPIPPRLLAQMNNRIIYDTEIDFENFTENGKGIQCLQVPSIDEMYDCYLAIVPGEILAKFPKINMC